MSGSAGLNLTGAGSLLVSSSYNGYSGATNVSGAALVVGAANALSPNSAYSIGATGALNLNGYNATIGALAGSGVITNSAASLNGLVVGAENTSTTFSGALTNAPTSEGLVLNLIGTGGLTLTNTASNYVGGTYISSGTLTMGGGSSSAEVTGIGAVNVLGGALAGSGTVAALNLAGGAVDFTLPSSTSAPPIIVSGALNPTAPTTINIGGSGAVAGDQYQLLSYAGSALSATQFAELQLGATPGGGLTYTLVNDTARQSVDVLRRPPRPFRRRRSPARHSTPRPAPITGIPPPRTGRAPPPCSAPAMP